ncbi:hypothetical protein FFF34_006260 [Inquilinus sp. KBS0705]|nr:hypothetical protein FFF34_006260 [Inquilinus sp. KBS0705]
MSWPFIWQVRASSLKFNAKTIVPSILLIIAYFLTIDLNTELNLNFFVGGFLPILPIILLIQLHDSIKVDLLKFITTTVAVILFFSILIWILLLSGIDLPSLGRVSNPAWDAYVYDNYFFCLRNILLYPNRFCAIFLEPGHLGMVGAFLLYANNFQIRRLPVLIILIAIFFTLSLAAYILTIFSFTLYVLIYSRQVLIYLVIWLILLISGYYFFTTYQGGANVINKKIISRLEYNESKGDIEGNNRVQKSFDNYYSSLINKDDIWFGIGAKRYNELKFGQGGNAGYKVYLVQNGIAGTAIVFLFYLSLVLYNRSKLGLALLVIYILAFIQRAYPLWSCELIIFITVLPPKLYDE